VEAALVVRQLQVQVLLQHAKGNPAYFWQHQASEQMAEFTFNC